MIDYQEIGNNIKICRIRCNLKQAELAEMAVLHPSTSATLRGVKRSRA